YSSFKNQGIAGVDLKEAGKVYIDEENNVAGESTTVGQEVLQNVSTLTSQVSTPLKEESLDYGEFSYSSVANIFMNFSTNCSPLPHEMHAIFAISIL
ncbi:hypothetical protein ABK046_45275, partial [Streptomyces caeruleatus]